MASCDASPPEDAPRAEAASAEFPPAAGKAPAFCFLESGLAEAEEKEGEGGETGETGETGEEETGEIGETLLEELEI
jgi:hypothetical protein